MKAFAGFLYLLFVMAWIGFLIFVGVHFLVKYW